MCFIWCWYLFWCMQNICISSLHLFCSFYIVKKNEKSHCSFCCSATEALESCWQKELCAFFVIKFFPLTQSFISFIFSVEIVSVFFSARICVCVTHLHWAVPGTSKTIQHEPKPMTFNWICKEKKERKSPSV